MAIKLVRELSQCGLKEAKDIVEQQLGFWVTANADSQARIAEEAARYGIEFDPPLDGTVASPITGTIEPRGCSVRYVFGDNKIAAIKLVRELTGLGLREAKDLVEQGGLVRTELTRSQAETIARQFAELGARVEVLEDGGSPRRGHVHDYQKEDDYDF